MRHEFRPSVESSGPLSTLPPLFRWMGNSFSHRLRFPLPGRLSRERVTTQPRSYDHFCGALLCFCMRAESASPLRPSLRGWLRPSLHLSLRGPVSPKGGQRPSQRRLRARRFADIPIRPPVQNIKGVLVIPSIFSASLALDACAIASALAPQRFSISLAVALLRFAIAVLVARLVVTRRSWGSA